MYSMVGIVSFIGITCLYSLASPLPESKVSCFSCPKNCVCSFPRLHHHKWIVNCSSINLTAVPSDISPAVEYLDLSNNHFYSDENFSVLKRFLHLKWLNVNNCGMVNITEDAICTILFPETVLIQGNKELAPTNKRVFCLTRNLKKLSIDAETLVLADKIPHSVETLVIHAGDNFQEWDNIWKKLLQQTSISSLRIHGRSLGSIPTEIINGMKNLHSLELISCQIKTLDVLINVKPVVRPKFYLCLSHNNIEKIPKNVFMLFKDTLRVSLDLSYNNISQADKESFNGIAHLDTLILDNNNLGHRNFEIILEALANKTVLELSFSSCNIDHNQMTRETFAPLRNSHIQKLNMGKNRFVNLGTDNLSHTPNLKEAIFGLFVYAQQDTERTDLKDIKYIYVPNIPGDTGWNLLSSPQPGAKHLERIKIENWNLDLRPQEMVKWRMASKLKIIELEDTKCGHGFDFELLQHLEEIYLHRTDCTGTHIRVSENSILKKFILKSNLNKIVLEEMHELFRNMSKLEVLDISNSNVIYNDETESSINQITSNLRELYLSQTNLKSIQYMFFKIFINLKILDLSHNKLDIVGNEVFKYTPNLEVIYLQGNVLQYIDPAGLQSLQNLNYIDISDNKFRCGCELRSFSALLKAAKKNATRDATRNLCHHRSSLNVIGIENICINTVNNSTQYTLENYEIFWMYCDDNMMRFFATLSAFLIIFIAAIASVIYRNRLSILILWNRLSLTVFKSRNRDYSYDCYISYSDEDTEIVMNIYDEIEEKPSQTTSKTSRHILRHPAFHFAFRDKDFPPGKAIIDNITTFMESSKTILFVLSKFSVNDVWCQFEAEYGLWSFVINNKRELIVLIVDEIKEDKMCVSLQNILKHSKIVRTSNGCMDRADIYTKIRAILGSEPGCLCQGCL